MEESRGCVRIRTTESPDHRAFNPGLMQNHHGPGTCWLGVNPCPYDRIEQMNRDGAIGTNEGDGLRRILPQTGASGAQAIYRAARIYNSGPMAPGYSSEIVNRLTGWVSDRSPF